MGPARDRPTYGSVLAIAEFRALWAADLFSTAGDQLARVALAVLVFARTDSALWTGLTYALTFVPVFLGGVLLGGLGDRYPRRAVMIIADLLRAVLVAAMAVPGMPLAVMAVLVAVATLCTGPFKAAQQALLPAVLSHDEATYEAGQSIRTVTNQISQLVGFAGGGALIAAINPSTALLADAGTFLASALILRTGVVHRPAAAPDRPTSRLTSFLTFAELVRRDPALRAALALSWLAGLYITPEALASPYAASLGAGAGAVGLLMASDPAGSVIGAYLWHWLVPQHRKALAAGLLGVLAGVPLMLCLAHPGLIASMALFGASGLCVTAYIIHSNAVFTLRVPDTRRAQGAGFYTAGLHTAQGLGAVLAGVLADWIGATGAIAIAGALGAILTVPIAVSWIRAPT